MSLRGPFGGPTLKCSASANCTKPVKPCPSLVVTVPGKAKADAAECVFFYFGPGQAGGAQANLQRWVQQFAADPKPVIKTEEAKHGETPVVYLFAEGTFMSGPPFGGAKVPKKDYGMAAAVLGTKPGYIFVKMTGPKEAVDSARAAFKTMIDSGIKK